MPESIKISVVPSVPQIQKSIHLLPAEKKESSSQSLCSTQMTLRILRKFLHAKQRSFLKNLKTSRRKMASTILKRFRLMNLLFLAVMKVTSAFSSMTLLLLEQRNHTACLLPARNIALSFVTIRQTEGCARKASMLASFQKNRWIPWN